MNPVEYFKQSQLSLAAYADLTGDPASYPNALREAGMSATQANKFSQQWVVMAQYNHTSDPYPVYDELGQLLRYDRATNGLSVTLFLEVSTGRKYLAIRGTDDLYDAATDLVSVLILGSTRFQGQYQSLKLKVQEWIDNGTLPAQFTVTGHSLGGFLATGLASEFSSNVSQAYLYNAPGVGSIAATEVGQRLLTALHIVAPAVDSGKVFNVRAEAGASPIAGLGLPVSPPIPIVIEDQFLSDVVNPPAARNHSQQVLTDALALYALYGELRPTLDVPTISTLLRRAANANARTLESALDALRKIVLGASTADTAIGDAERFYANLKALSDSLTFRDLVGRVRIEPSGVELASRVGAEFSSLASLLTLSPVTLRGTDTASQVYLDSKLATVWGQTYLDWQTDRTMSQADREAGKETFTDAWIADRAQFIGAVVAKNMKDESDTVLVSEPGALRNAAMLDIATGRTVLSGAVNSNQRAQVVFGGTGNDPLDGFGKADHLYGGAGNDALNGQGGTDWLEGNIDNDILSGGSGNDTLLGGKGDDFLEGGADDDSLLGGQGTDTYFFTAGWGHDVIEDSDGQGSLRVPGYEAGLPIGKKVPGMTGVYRSADNAVTYTLSSDGKTLAIGFDGRTDSIVVRNWQPGQLGIALDDASLPPEQYGSVFTDQQGQAANITVAEAPPSDGRNPAIRPPSQLSTSVAIDALDGGDMVSTVGRTMYYFVPTAQMLAQVAPDFHRDRVDGGVGNDTVYTGDGRDTVLGGAGDDVITAGLYVPAVYPQFFSDMPLPNEDFILLPDGTTVNTNYYFSTSQNEADIQAIAERDFFETRRRYDANVVDAGDGADTVRAGWGDDVVHGGIGDDVIAGQAGDDALFGDDGADQIYGDSRAIHVLQEFTLIGTDGQPFTYRRVDPFFTPGDLNGQDTLDGGGGDDWLFGMGADDTVLGGTGNDSLFGDTDYNSPPPLDPEFLVNPDFVPNEFHGNDYLDGGDGADQLVGGALDDRLFGGGGNDRMWGDSNVPGLTVVLHGDDTLDGGDGDDSVMGGGGSDEIAGGIGNDSIFGDDAESIVAASAHGDDTIDAGDGNDTVFGGGGSDFILGEAGADQIAGDGGTDSTLTGDDWIDGGEGDDLIFGDGGNDWVQGGAGADSLRGGDGADTLEGGAGKDDLSGGSGNDIYRFDVGDSPVDATGVGEAIRDGGGIDSIELGANVDLNGVRVLSDGVALLAIDYSSTDRVAIDGGLGGTIESFRFADGQVLSWTELIRLPRELALRLAVRTTIQWRSLVGWALHRVAAATTPSLARAAATAIASAWVTAAM
jgi:Ca2+-binding RTX toxin-like protein